MNRNDSLFHSLPQPWDRILPYVATLMVWGVLLGVIYLLRSFFLLLFLTFVFSYIQAQSVNRLESRISNRIVRVVFVALFFLCILTAAGIFLVPTVKKQTGVFVSQFTTYINRVDQELFTLERKYPLLGELLPEIVPKEGLNPLEGSEKKSLKHSPAASLFQRFLGLGETTSGLHNVNQVLDTLGNIGGKLASAASTFLLSLLFSFLIVLDLANLEASVQGWHRPNSVSSIGAWPEISEIFPWFSAKRLRPN